MSISMKNLSDRITALENKINSGALGGWEKGSNSNGYWLKEKTTGIIIQWGTAKDIGGNRPSTFVFPIKFSNTDYHLSLGFNGTFNASAWLSVTQYRDMRTSQATISNTASQVGLYRWFAIGYLISYRILNYIYKGIMHFLCGKKLKIFGLNKGGVYAKCQLV